MNKLIEIVIFNTFYIISDDITKAIREYLIANDIEDFVYDKDENYNLITAMIYEWLEMNNIEE